MDKLAATTSDCVEDLLAWLRGELAEMDYGEVGLTFTVHDGGVVKWRQIKQVTGKP